MDKPISSKPTVYRGITFRSRLEARWAIFLENSASVLKWTYEPATYHLLPQNWDYTPDFRVWHKSGNTFDLEVKPNEVTLDYAKVLVAFRRVMPYDLYVLTGNWYDVPLAVSLSLTAVRLCKVPTIETLFPIHSQAFEFARTYRFDLIGGSDGNTSPGLPRSARQDNRGSKPQKQAGSRNSNRSRHKTKGRRRGTR